MRADFLYLRANPLVPLIEKKLHQHHLKDPRRQIVSNILAFYYGVHFYNTVSGSALYPFDKKPTVKLVANHVLPIIAYTYDGSSYIHLNIKSPFFKDEYKIDPLSDYSYHEEDPEIEIPVYLIHILDGIEEASHLHLQNLHLLHGANRNSQSDHHHPNVLWRKSADDPISYRSKLWHEFAALVLHQQFFKYYLAQNFPDATLAMNILLEKIKLSRQQWIGGHYK